MNPVICYENLIESAASITVTAEAAGFEKENAYDGLTFDHWRASAAGTNDYTVDLGSAQPVDYWALYGHDLADYAGSVTFQYSSDNFAADVNTVGAAVTPSDSGAIVRAFDSISARYWRFRFVTTGTPASIAALAFGARLTLPEAPGVGFIPPTLSYDDEVTNQRAEGGAFLGRSLRRYGGQTELTFDLMPPAWVRTDWAPFLAHARIKPFFISWDAENYPAEAAFCYTDGRLEAPSYSHSLYMRVSIKVKALTR